MIVHLPIIIISKSWCNIVVGAEPKLDPMIGLFKNTLWDTIMRYGVYFPLYIGPGMRRELVSIMGLTFSL